MQDDAESPDRPIGEVLSTLVANHREFLRFVERRVGSRDVAEEILQAAFVKSAEQTGTVRESAVGWFYTVLRNAITDHHRRQAAAGRRHEVLAREAASTGDHDAELHAVVCTCVRELASTLKPEYADALQAIEIDGVSVKDYAEKIGITSGNAGVRVFRARDALRKQVARACGTCADHGCVDCTCKAGATRP